MALNFNRSGDKFTTLLGGMISIAVKILLSLFLFVKLKALIGHNDNNVGFFKELISDDYDGLTIKNKGFLWFMMIDSLEAPVYDISVFKKYVNIEASMTKDYQNI